MHSHDAGTRTFETPANMSGTTDTDQHRSLIRNDTRDQTERAQYNMLRTLTTYAALHSFLLNPSLSISIITIKTLKTTTAHTTSPHHELYPPTTNHSRYIGNSEPSADHAPTFDFTSRDDLCSSPNPTPAITPLDTRTILPSSYLPSYHEKRTDA
jgi:hypothetical protein